MSTETPPTLPANDRRAGAGPTLVFLHYWGGSARTWAPVIERLHGRDTIAVAARGRGRSRHLPGPYTLEESASDVRRVVAEAGLTEYIVVGHSMGGKVAQLVGAEHPEGLAGLGLVAPAPAEPSEAVTPVYRQQLSHAYDTAETVAGARDHILTASSLPDDIKDQIVVDSLNGAEPARLEWPLHGISQDVTAATRTIKVPVLVVAGENDLVEPPAVLGEKLLPYLPHAEFTVIPGTGHLIPLEAPIELARAIAQFT